ncbi:MAG: hypothetical protein QXU81_00215 [Candidatus Bathyarchaeia archaeon]
MKLERIPWFSIAGVLVLLSMLLYTPADPYFVELHLPTYLTQAITYICLGYVFLKDDVEHKGFIALCMSSVLLLNQIVHLANLEATFKIASVWLMFLAQALLLYLFYADEKIKYIGSGGTWAYAAVWLIFVFAVAKLWVSASAPAFQIPTWGFAIAVLSAGYLVKPISDDAGLTLQVIGTVLSALAALTVGGPGLMLV